MVNRLYILIVPILFFSCKDTKQSSHQEQLIISFYNVENLFDTKDDPKKQDNEFLPRGNYKWTKERYEQKLKNLAHVIKDLNSDLIGLSEVENKEVLKDLISYVPELGYKIVHTESYDIRGIDIALLYKPEKLSFLEKIDITARMTNGRYAGPRNILKASFKTQNDQKEIDFYINHWPSRRGGKERNRISFANKLAQQVNSDKSPYVILGDFNDTPENTSMKKLTNQIEHLNNPFSTLKDQGTIVYKNKWFLFDQILVDNSSIEIESFKINTLDYLQNQKTGKYKGYPKRTFVGKRYNPEGISDHFPVSAIIKLR